MELLAEVVEGVEAMLEVVGLQYVFEVVQKVGDGFALGIGEDIVVVDFGAACWCAWQLATAVWRLA